MIFKLTLSRKFFDKEEEQEMNNLKGMGFHFEKKDFAETFGVYNFTIDFRAMTIEVQNGYAK